MIVEPIPMSEKTSVEAVREYICCKKGNENRHKAFVLTSEKGQSYPVVLYVYAQVSGCSAKVIVEWKGSYGNDYPSEFTTTNSSFSFSHKCLHITSTDLFNQPSSISISVIS